MVRGLHLPASGAARSRAAEGHDALDRAIRHGGRHEALERAAGRRGARFGRRGGGGSVSWSPAALGSKLTLWLDQRDLVVTGGAYSDWGDQSPAGNRDFAMATATNRPDDDLTVNGWAAPNFDGVDNFMQGPAAVGGDGYTSASASRILVVVDTTGETPGADSANVYQEAAIIALGSTAGWLGLTWTTSGPRAYGYDGAFKATARAAGATGSASDVGVALLDIKHDGTTFTLRRGAGTPVTVACGALITPGIRAIIGCNYAAAAFYAGRIASIVACNAALSAGEESAARSYLFAKYGAPS